MNLIESELEGALHPAVKAKSHSKRKLRVKAARVAGGSSEVMVKVTGFGKGAAHVKAHLDYITRNGELEMENERGEVFKGKEAVRTLFLDWEKDFGDGKRYKNQRDTMKLMLSMPEHIDSESVRNAVREFAKSRFGNNNEYVFALHTDQRHPHCHLTVKCLGFDGRRLNPRKADLQEWREVFAEMLRDQGVDAEATPRRSRGVVRKPEPTVIRHIERGDKTHNPRVSKIRAAKVKEAAEELTAEAAGLPITSKPWEDAIKARQSAVRRAWLTTAAGLEHEDTRITFNQKEAHNAHPDYESISAERARSGQRSAAVYQSRIAEFGPQTPAQSIAGLRNVSGCPVVQHERASKMLLQSNAPDRLGLSGSADSKMRRPRVGASRARGGDETLSEQRSTGAANKALAERIRAFVDAMPPLETERGLLKQELTQKFTKTSDLEMSAEGVVRPKSPVQQSEMRQDSRVERGTKVRNPNDLDR